MFYSKCNLLILLFIITIVILPLESSTFVSKVTELTRDKIKRGLSEQVGKFYHIHFTAFLLLH